MTVYELRIEVNDEAPRAALARGIVTDRLATILALGNYDDISVIVQTAPQATGPIAVRVRDGKIHTERGRLLPSSGGSRDQSAQTAASRKARRLGTAPDARD